MVGPNKILTVSYGAFSCTLEGFDEPFVMMKAVAEYFRDLAAEDRYFGAEPPKPDEAMLQKIAEREIQRRVEAKISDHAIALKQAEPMAAAPAPVETPAAVVTPAPVVAAAAEEVAVREPVPAAETVMAEEPEAEAAPDDADMAEDAMPLVTVSTEDEADLAEEMAEPLLADDDQPQAADQPVEPTEAPITPEVVEAALKPSGTADQDTIAAKLMRIRAVVEGVRSSQTAGLRDEDVSALTAPVAPPQPTYDFAQADDAAEPTSRRVTRVLTAQPIAEEVYDEEEPLLLDDAAGELRGSFLDEDEDEAGGHAEADDVDSELLSRIARLRAAEAEAMSHRPEPQPLPPTPPAAATHGPIGADADTAPDDSASDHAPSGDEGSESASFYQRARARVLRIGKAAALIGRHPSEDGHGEPAADFDAPDHDSDEAHPSAQIAARPEDDFSRLMEEARQKLEGVENRRRFSAISHLKAAVAATLADRKVHDPDGQAAAQAAAAETEIEAYRHDLSRAVRPHRPGTGRPTTLRPQAAITPLVLVSEQRVDLPLDRFEGSVRPRRISGNVAVSALEDEDDHADDIDITPESASSFAEFANRLGAHSLTELLEAAAVYTASIEGQPYFSRPHILRKVEFVSSRGQFNREDGLRSFGTLLREGKIMKVSRGQFAVAEASKYMIETRRSALH